MTTSQQFNGFTLPDGAWLPPELLYLLPTLSYAQLKVTIAAIYHHAQVGGAEPLTLNDFERLTGMTRSPITKALTWLLGDNDHGLKVLEREQIDRTFVYRPRLRMSRVSRLSLKDESSKSTLDTPESRVSRLSKAEKERESESQLNKDIKSFNSSDSLSNLTDSTTSERLATRLSLLQDLRSAGIYLKTAQGLVTNYPEDRIREKMAYFPYALGIGFANGPGWLVAAIKEDWPPPLGYEPPTDSGQPSGVDAAICPDCSQYPCVCEVVCGQCMQSPCSCEGPPTPTYDGPAKVARAWDAAKGQLQLEMPHASFSTWVKPAWLASYDDDGQVVVIGTRNEYARDWLESRLSSTIRRLLTGILNQSVGVRFEVPDAA